MKRLLLAASSLLALTAPAAADPIITPLVTAALTAEIAGTAIVGSLTVGALVTGVVELGIVAGASLLLKPKHQVKSDPSVPLAPTLQAIGPQSISNRYYGAGRYMVGGVYPWWECLDGQHAIMSSILNCETIDGVEAYLIDGENITSWAFGPFNQLTGFIQGVMIQVNVGPDTRWPTAGLKFPFQYVQHWINNQWTNVPIGNLPAMVFDFRNGLPGGNPSPLAAHYLPGLYNTTDHKHCNLAVMYAMAVGGKVIVERMTTYPRAWPQMSFVIRAATIYDPRDPAQSFDGSLISQYAPRADYLAWYFGQKATWTFSRNSILVLLWYLMHYDGGHRHPSKIYWPDWIAAADYCDRPVPKFGGGTEPWARTDAQWHTGEAQRDVIARLSAACDATVWEDGEGRLRVFILQDMVPTADPLTDADISSIVIEEGSRALDEINHLTPSYMEPRENYQMIPAAPVTDDESIGLVGERPDTISFKEIVSFGQVHRLTYRVLKRKNPERKLTITGGPSLLRFVGEIVIPVDSLRIPDINGVYRFSSRAKVDPALNQITISLALVGPNDYDDVVPPYDPVSPFETSTVPPPSPVAVQTPDAPTLVEDEIAGAKYIQATAKVGGATPTDSSLSYYAQARVVDETTHDPLGPWSIFPTAISEWVRQSGTVSSTLTYEVRGWFVQNQTPSQMSGPSYITISGPLSFDNSIETFDGDVATWDIG